MKLWFFIGVFCLFLACSGPENSEKQSLPVETNTAPIPVAEKPASYSAEFKQIVLYALSNGYTPLDPDTFVVIPANEHFSLLNPTGYFDEQQSLYIQQSQSVRVQLFKNGTVVLEERTFTSQHDLGSILGAMTRKLDDPRQERFLRRPFTYWPFNESLCHIFTEQEKDRKKMDELYEEWVKYQTPKE